MHHSSAGRSPSGSRLAAPSLSAGGWSGHAPVGPVERHPTAVGLGVDRTAGRDEGGDVRDGVPDPDAAAPAALGPVGLVEVAAARGVDRDQGDVGAVRVARRVGRHLQAGGRGRAGTEGGVDRGRRPRAGSRSGTPCSARTAAIPAATSPAGAPAARWIGGVGTPANLVLPGRSRLRRARFAARQDADDRRTSAATQDPAVPGQVRGRCRHPPPRARLDAPAASPRVSVTRRDGRRGPQHHLVAVLEERAAWPRPR